MSSVGEQLGELPQPQTDTIQLVIDRIRPGERNDPAHTGYPRDMRHRAAAWT